MSNDVMPPCWRERERERGETESLSEEQDLLLESEGQRQILIIKPTRCTNFSNLFWNTTLHVSGSFSFHHQESSTVHTAIGIYVIQVILTAC